MNVIKKNISKIIIVFIIVCAVSIVTLLFAAFVSIRTSYNMEQMDYNKKIHIKNVQNFVNPIEEEHTKIIDESYRAAFLHEYVYEDIYFLTSCEGWDETRLEFAARELFNNTHGEEINLITAVVFEEGDGAFTYGYHQSGNEYYAFPAEIHGVFPESCAYNHVLKKSVLYVTNVTARTDVGDYAQALSIAYGYHFVNHYMGIEGNDDDKDTEYYRIRAEGNDNVKLEFEDNDDYMDNYEWDLETIAANDYMYLMGSHSANRIVNSLQNKYYDDIDLDTWEGVYQAVMSRYINARNITPHMNIYMDLPDSVDGLADYFYSFVDDDTPEDTQAEPMGEITFSLERNTKGGTQYQYQDTLHWTAPYDTVGVQYTVLEYSMDDVLMDILDFTSGQGEKQTNIKHYTIVNTEFGAKAIGRISENQVKIRVIATFRDGSIAISEPYEYVYDEKKLEEESEE